MTLRDIRIDDRCWNQADAGRRREFQACILDMLRDPLVSFPDGATVLRIGVAEQCTTLSYHDKSERVLGTCVISRSSISPHVKEYVDIVRQLDAADHRGRIEALDMAKKLSHDDAARRLAELCAPLGLDHATARRLFTLLLTLNVDTTRLTGVRGHRPVR